jgi:hypothetical protein
MIAHFKVMQGSMDWHLLRHGKIGGSASKGLFVKSDTLLLELVAEHCEEWNEDEMPYISSDMQRGNDLEPEAREEAAKLLGVDFLECGWIQSDIELLGISPDGITADFTQAIEVKCPAAKKHAQTIVEDEIPLDNLHQCIHYFTVNPRLERLHFVSYRPENKYKPIFIKTLSRTDKVNIGTKARPIIKTVLECTEIAKNEAIIIQDELNKIINQLTEF